MDRMPALELYVTRGCESCCRAERVLRQCVRISGLVRLRVLELGDPGIQPPAAVFGGPTVVFRGRVVALGTPDCTELAQRLELLVRNAE